MAKKNIVVIESDDLSAVLRQLVDDSGSTRYVIARESGVLQSSLSRAYSGQTATTFELLKKVAESLGMIVTVTVKKS